MTSTADEDLLHKVSTMVLPGAPRKDPNKVSKGERLTGHASLSVQNVGIVRRDHPLPIPNGWYSIAATDELEIGDVRSMFAIDRDLVVFRNESGEAQVFDAHCAHLGAHLGGGRIEGDTLKCPYHGWEYGPGGRCTNIPYATGKIPPKAVVRSYPVSEKHGVIYFWYHAGEAPPSFDISDISEVDDPNWSDAHVWHFELVGHLQEMGENNVDYAHLRYVHRREEVPAENSVFTTDGPFSRVVETLPDGPVFTRDTIGPGIALLRVPDLMTLIATTTPIDKGTVHLHWRFYFPRSMEHLADDLIEGVTGPYGLQADVPIWRDKIYRPRPVLVKEDGPILEYRRWYAQFYEGQADPPTLSQ